MCMRVCVHVCVVQHRLVCVHACVSVHVECVCSSVCMCVHPGRTSSRQSPEPRLGVSSPRVPRLPLLGDAPSLQRPPPVTQRLWGVGGDRGGARNRAEKGAGGCSSEVLPTEPSRPPAATCRGGSAVTRVHRCQGTQACWPMCRNRLQPQRGSRAMRASGSWEVGVPRGPCRDLRGGLGRGAEGRWVCWRGGVPA